MARHTWTATRFTDGTVASVLEAIRVAMAAGLGREDAARFGGYYMETLRQAGLKGTYLPGPDGHPRFGYRNQLDRMLARCQATGHKYARGRNRANYLDGARRLLAQAAGLDVLAAPLDVALDKLMESDQLPVC
jgi:hypothetical protein